MGLFSKTSKEPEDSLGVPGEEGEDLGEAPGEPPEESTEEPENELWLKARRERERREGKAEKGDIFGDKRYIKRKEVASRFAKKAPHKIPGSRRWYKREERRGLAEELFERAGRIKGSKHKEYMTREELGRVMKKLRKESLSGSLQDKIRTKEKIRWLQKQLGSDFKK